MIKTVQMLVSGRVQGVCYRASTQKVARQLQIDGWVRNLPNGDVEIYAQGDAQLLEQLIAWCHKGPTFARVDSVKVIEVETPDLMTGFIIT